MRLLFSIIAIFLSPQLITSFTHTTRKLNLGGTHSRLGRRDLYYDLPSSRRSVKHSLTISMHMGHSHAHHSHEHINGNIVNGNESQSVSQKPRKRPRLIALIIFTALATLGPPLIRKRAISRADAAAFILTSSSLSMFDVIRREIKYAFAKFKDMRDGIAKHSTPLDTNYFFKNENAADRVTMLGGVVNVLLSVGKGIIGVLFHSSALIADAGHSLSDLFSDVITLYSVQLARLPPDDDHPYGHGKFEAVGSLFLALTLLATGVSVGIVSNKKLIEIISIQRTSGLVAAGSLVQIPKAPALLMAALSIFSKEWLYRITRNVGEKLNSQVVIANAWHHRSDAYSSILALISIGLAMSYPGFLAADSAAGMLVAGMICMTGAEIMGESIKQLTDSQNEEVVQEVTDLAANSDDVLDVKRVRARQVGSKAIVDVGVSLSDDLASSAARAIEERLRQRILEVPNVLDAEVHATSPGVVCPLLVATDSSENDHHSEVSEVENDVRTVAEAHPKVDSVEGITVHYQDTLLINVDVDIRLDAGETVAEAKAVATEVRENLENNTEINQANIFLDLNEGAVKI